MIYFSPFHLISNPEKMNLKLEKRRVLAEFTLAEASSINISGRALNQDDVIRLFEMIEEPDDRDFHYQIFTISGLSDFLELKEVSMGQLLNLMNGLEPSESFIERVSSFFAYSFSERMLRAFKERDVATLKALKSMPRWMTPLDQEEAFRPVERILENYISDLKDKKRKGKYFSWEQDLKPYFGERIINCLNALPRDYQKLIDRFAFHFADYFYEMHRRKIRRPLVGILYHLRHLHCDPELRSNFESNYKKLATSYPSAIPETDQEKRKNNRLTAIMIIAVVLIPMAIVMVITGMAGKTKSIYIEDTGRLDSLMRQQYYYDKDSNVYALNSYVEPEMKPLGIPIYMMPFLQLLKHDEFSHPLLDDHRTRAKNMFIMENLSDDEVIVFLTDSNRILFHHYVYPKDTVVVNYRRAYQYVVNQPEHRQISIYAMTGRGWDNLYPFEYRGKKETGLFKIQDEDFHGVFSTGLKFRYGGDQFDQADSSRLFQSYILRIQGNYQSPSFTLRDTLLAEPDSLFRPKIKIPVNRSLSP